MGAGQGKLKRVKSKQHNIMAHSYSIQEPIEIETNMYPGAASKNGFLAPNERLSNVIKQDEATLANIGITHEELIDAFMEPVAAIINPMRGGGIYECEDFLIVCGPNGYRGSQYCPFILPNEERKTCSAHTAKYHTCLDNMVFEITSKKHKKSVRSYLKIQLRDQLPHLIRDHHFFEGNVKHRIDPNLLVQILNLGIYKK